ncbi:hypothetical protein AMECASPLE_031327 [Ameca splendens]|uniref:Uncharacterized protein n=1 Tax=Ameca splendens TaxID=208324 RepID=A0ABV0Y6P2_9TELE
MYPGHELPLSQSLCQARDNIRIILSGLLLSGPKPCFQIKVNFEFQLEIKVPECGGSVEMDGNQAVLGSRLLRVYCVQADSSNTAFNRCSYVNINYIYILK